MSIDCLHKNRKKEFYPVACGVVREQFLCLDCEEMLSLGHAHALERAEKAEETVAMDAKYLQKIRAKKIKAEARVKELGEQVALLQAFAQKVRDHIGSDTYYMIQDQVWKANGLTSIQGIQVDE